MQLNFINTLPCDVDIHYKIGTHSAELSLKPTNFAIVENLPAGETIMILKAIANGNNCTALANELETVELGTGNGKSSYSVLITQRNYNMTVFRMNQEEQIEKSVSGDPLLGYVNSITADDNRILNSFVSLT